MFPGVIAKACSKFKLFQLTDHRGSGYLKQMNLLKMLITGLN